MALFDLGGQRDEIVWPGAQVLTVAHATQISIESVRSLRSDHTAAAVWLSLGFPVEYVRRQMGHRDIATTIRNYGHLERTLIPDAAARTEAAVLGDQKSLVAIW